MADGSSFPVYMSRGPEANALAASRCREIAARLREKPGAWTQGVYARDSMGCSADPHGPLARSWCVLGFIELVCYGQPEARASMADMMERLLGGHSVPAWNDASDRTVSDVIALFELAAHRFSRFSCATPDWSEIAKPLVSFDSIMKEIEAEAA